MPSGPLAGNHPRKFKTYAVGEDVVTVTPAPKQWDRIASYFVQVNGEDRGKITYRRSRYTQGWGGTSHWPHAGDWEGSKALSWNQGQEVTLGDGTFAGAVAAFPQAVRDGKFPTLEERDAELAVVDARLAAKKADEERQRREWEAQRELDAARKEAERAQVLEGLQSIRDTFGIALSNYEAAALAAAIKRYGE